jgi:type II secretory pathway pseudopilin PulG
MKPLNEVGFTIIETMLFLAITALLILGVLAGTGSSINTQRYRDSITSLQAFLQQQYSDVSNVSNDSSNNACYGDETTDNLRGQSNCVILGRYITTTNNSQTLSVESVIGYISPDSVVESNDLAAIQDYKIQISSLNSENYDIEWNSSLVFPGGSQPATISILIVRSPISGIIRTFIDPNNVIKNSDITKYLINLTALTKSAKVCVDSNGLFAGTKMAVIVDAGASGASGVETLGDKSGC